ncbi:hypothetical protein ACFL6U_16865 [Planctomycetota bacterium]
MSNDRLGDWLYTTVALLILLLAIVAGAQDSQSVDGYDPLNQEGLKQIDRISEAMRKAGKISAIVGIALLALLGLRMLAPLSWLDSIEEKRLAKAVKGVEELLDRIRVHAENASSESDDPVADEGLLAGMMAVTDWTEGEDVPSYVLTVNDIMLDNILNALTRLRRLRVARAERYRENMFTVLSGIKIITEECEATGAASSLAVDSRDYFKDDQRYHDWKHLMNAYAKRGDHREFTQVFLLFLKNLHEGQPLTVTFSTPARTAIKAEVPNKKGPEIPEILLDETLPLIKQAALEEARHLVTIIKSDHTTDDTHAWQFELVRRQQQLHLREDARNMLRIFLHKERKALQGICKTRMLPCKTWDQFLYMLGVKNTAQLQTRVEQKLLTGQEIIILEKAFLQTFAKRKALQQLYGHDTSAGVMIDLHIPQIRSETLALLRHTHEMEKEDLDQATEALDEEETPQRHQVAKLIKHFIHHGHFPPGFESKETSV